MSTSDEPEFGVQNGWEQLPAGFLHKDASDVAVDHDDKLFLLTRYDAGVLVYDSGGSFVRSFGGDVLSERPHGITIAPDGNVYIVDEWDQTIKKFTSEGELLGIFGKSGEHSDTGYDQEAPTRKGRVASITRAAGPFNHPTAIALTESSEMYVSDGYGNARVHRLSSTGELIHSWGEPGTGPSRFHLVHHVSLDLQGRLLVTDRENDRIQIFAPDGTYLEEWTDVSRPAATTVDPQGLVYIPELPRPEGDWSWVHGTTEVPQPARLTILDSETGKVIRRIGLNARDSTAPGFFTAPHGVAVDSSGDVYVSEVTYSSFDFRSHPTAASGYDETAPTCHKLVRCDTQATGSSVVRLDPISL